MAYYLSDNIFSRGIILKNKFHSNFAFYHKLKSASSILSNTNTHLRHSLVLPKMCISRLGLRKSENKS